MRFTLAAFVAAILWMSVLGAERQRADARSAPVTARGAPAWFIDATKEAGLDFVHFNGMTGEFYYAEIIAPGVALFDSDNDGDLDVFLVQGQPLGAGRPLFPRSDSRPLKGRLFRNDLQVFPDGTRRVRFTDITDESGITATGYGMGVAAGDYDNDGCIDLYLTAFGQNQLFRNTCRGTFTDVSAESGAADTGWSVSAAFVDVDRDGWLDLHVGHYLNWDVALNTPCLGSSGRRVYCAPRVYRAQRSRLYRNNHDGTFADVTEAAGMGTQYGAALGVATADFNGDGWVDLYVANDGTDNQLWINQRDGTFQNLGLLSGTALGPYGEAKAGMGVDAGDFDDDGDEDLFVTNLAGEGHDFYVNDGSGVFENRSAHSGIGYLSLPYTGFGAAWFDFDNDGRLDILTVNGAVQTDLSVADQSDLFPLRQRNQLFRNLGDGRFDDVTSAAGPAFEALAVGRGAAFGDIDNDGDTDVLVGNNNGSPRLLLNQVGNEHHWLGLRLARQDAGADAIGARVAVLRNGETTRWRRARADGSYASANDPRVLVGLESSTAAPTIQVTWPNGDVEEWPQVPIDRYITLRQGEGRARP